LPLSQCIQRDKDDLIVHGILHILKDVWQQRIIIINGNAMSYKPLFGARRRLNGVAAERNALALMSATRRL
jgi:hypothetical protein